MDSGGNHNPRERRFLRGIRGLEIKGQEVKMFDLSDYLGGGEDGQRN